MIICHIDIKKYLAHRLSTTSNASMSFLDVNYDVKSITAKHLSNDYKISMMFMSKPYHL